MFPYCEMHSTQRQGLGGIVVDEELPDFVESRT